ncbi:hypothetical protein PSEUDO9AZ_30075 [Pseudomonas sp. 9AZ]|nr:hypothetical protein PSEUDO9AZ_30075 [Pseudomonas sp. 9AZ]
MHGQAAAKHFCFALVLGECWCLWRATALAGQRFALSFLDKLLEPTQHLHRLPARGVEHGIGQALITDHIQLTVIAGALQQGFDLGKAGVEVHPGKRRFALGDNAFKLQFIDGGPDFFQGHAVYAVFQLQYIEHLGTPVNALYGPDFPGGMVGWMA